jgi:hypothetical protein
MMNKTLYTLTLITAVATPLMFLTGLFGMNFTDMTELVRLPLRVRPRPARRGAAQAHAACAGRQDPESGMGYYNFFWPLFGSTFAAVLLLMLRLRLFAALM